MNIEKTFDFIKKHADFFSVIGLCILCYFIFFHNIGNYALMDVDETRYVAMSRDMFHSKDFLTLYLNGDYFFEKPPLYFWGECLSFAFFGKINEFTARFPVALYGTLSTLLVYFTGKKIVSRNYGIIASLILATSLEFIILAKFAILDIVVSTCIGFSVMFGFLTQFVQEKNKKYFWWLFYIFSGLAVMAKGIPGFVVPFGTMFFVSIANRKFKEIFKPQYFLVGFALFFLIVIPWHLIMFKIHDPLFFHEYIIKHHLERFVNSNEIGRKQPFYFYFLTFLWGFFPWVLSAISVAIALSIKHFKYLKSFKMFNINEFTNPQKFLLFNWIGLLVTFLFFSSSSTKLITYILPVYFFSACIMGFVWQDYIEKDKFRKSVNISVYILSGICLFASFAALFTPLFLPVGLYLDILPAKWLCIILLTVFGFASLIFTLKNKKWQVFFSYVIFMAALSAFGTKEFFNIDYKFGQNDLMEFAQLAKDNDDKLATFGFSRRFSLLYYYGKHVDYQIEKDYSVLKKQLSDKNTVVIVKNKEMIDIPVDVHFNPIAQGRKYTLIKGK